VFGGNRQPALKQIEVIVAASFALRSFNLHGTPDTPCHLWMNSGPNFEAEKAEKHAIAQSIFPYGWHS